MRRTLLIIVALAAVAFAGVWLYRAKSAPPPVATPSQEPNENDWGDGRVAYLIVKHPDAGVATLPPDSGQLPTTTPQALTLGEPAISTTTDAGATLPRDETERVLRAVTPIIQQCFDDLHGRYRDGFSVEVSFAISESAGQQASLSRAEISKMSVEDPYLRACLEDAPLDTHVESRETGGARVSVPVQFR